MAGKRVVAVDSDVDLKTLAMLLTEEERQAVLEDARTPLMEFVKQEASGMVVMSMPLIFVVLVEQLPNVAMMAMLGQIDPVHSTEILAACGIAGIFQTVVLSGVVSGLGGALDTVCAQAYGAKRYAEF
ncbi:hypothetical protein Poli38472_002614 [Pythium oligandrum]|uniref:Uncharacterized protein n=1 Tax=Pythium oligandrum TaxID=41045 RepID=A0A8K1FMH8_PYTOL|nr:hypothetical protein Poli38472_002614 [Pythium oligandrum]|eukprot:TMW63673.1 hypothetical protein Poli38472_002614 [Pythium oligandrum]